MSQQLPPPSQWPERALGVTFTILIIAVLLNVAVHLIEAVLPFLLGVAVAVGVGYGAWILHEHRRSRW